MAEKAQNEQENYELTYIHPNSDGDVLYQGFYNYAGDKHTMGSQFGKLLQKHNPKLIVHLHPLKDEKKYLAPVSTMFSSGDRYYIERDDNAVWIGIEPHKGANGYYIDTYISKNKWGRVIRNPYEGEVVPGKHWERIENKEIKPKFHNGYKK
ncbi:hypothetical protein AGMMS49938_14390 [Fibrobacterales bacterium]|nr:hypothetical protein AGMMS49938_14390 [Fibrobacterales bacterium]